MVINRKIVSSIIAGILMSSSSASAKDVGPGYVDYLYVHANGIIAYNVTGPSTGTWPACATTQRFAINANSPGGQALYAAVIGAKLAGKRVYTNGDGTCSIWSDSETVWYVWVEPG